VDPRRDVVVETVERVMPAVVNIATEEVVEYRDPFADLFREFWGFYYRNRPRSTRFSLGSGVIIDEDGYVLTNLHVVQRATKVWVQFADGREFEAQPIVGTTRRDVALLRLVAADDEKFHAIRFAGDDDLLLGETVLALGNPFGLGGSVSRGILSSKNRRPTLEDQPLAVEDWLQTDAAINPGSSGGPLVNLRAELIGLNVAVHSEGQGIGFAIPIRQIAEALSGIFTPEVETSRWFGARLKPGTTPLRIIAVDRDSPAEIAGLRTGDLVTTINETSPRSFVHGMLLLTQDPDAKTVRLKLQRDGKPHELSVKFGDLESLIQKRIGVTAQEMDAVLAQQFGLAAGQGLLVSHVETDSPAARASFEAGHVIAAIDDMATPDLLSAATALGPKAHDETVTVSVLVERRRGPFRQMQQVRVRLNVR
jgi:S1-C subfamily serine protease